MAKKTNQPDPLEFQYPESVRRRWQHPYLFFSRDEVPALVEKIKKPAFELSYKSFLALSAEDLDRPCANTVGMWSNEKPLGGSRGFQAIVCRMGFMHLITGEQKYLDRCMQEIEATAVIDWIAPLFSKDDPANSIWYADLCLAERAHAIGFAYDWMHESLTEEQRSVLRGIAKEKALIPYWMGAQRRGEWGCREYMNWNGVVNGGVGTLALSMLGEMPEAHRALEVARWLLPRFATAIGQDGGWDEGLMYSSYGARNAGNFLVALQNTLGTDDGLIKYYRNLGYYTEMLRWRDREGRKCQFRFRDSNSSGASLVVQLLKFFPENEDYLKLYDADTIAKREAIAKREGSGDPSGVPTIKLWRHDDLFMRPDKPLTTGKVSFPQAKLFRDINVFCYRGEQLHFCALGIDTGKNHAHFDMGAFELVFAGEQLITDLNYGDISSLLHNCLRVNGQGQCHRLAGRMYGFVENKKEGWTAISIELPALYGPILKSYYRHYLIVHDSVAVIVDEVVAAEAVTLETAFTTYHTAEANGSTARIYSPEVGLSVSAHPAMGASAFRIDALESVRKSDEEYLQAVSKLDDKVETATWMHVIAAAETSAKEKPAAVDFPEPENPLCFGLTCGEGGRKIFTSVRTSEATLDWSVADGPAS